MKKSKIWIHVCVHLLLCITLGVYSSKLDVNPVTDDIARLSVLRQNIPKDYRIPVEYIPKEEGGMCWVKLNLFNLERSLDDLSQKFGNISSNRKDISIFIQMLQEVRINMGSLEMIMLDFQCHYRTEKWQTAQYFDFVKDFFVAAKNREYSDDCDPPPCPTTTSQTVTTHVSPCDPRLINPPLLCLFVFFPPTPGETTPTPTPTPTCQTGCSPQPRVLSEMMERSLLSLLFIPLLVLAFLLVWKVRSRRNREDLQQNPGNGGLLVGTEVTALPLNGEMSEKNHLNVIETV
ncbi:kit ligand a isoform X2 [Channa argus]|uniref:kit ligand a isoform X2 n=1 Tax=Channa argus TaxID=215402 RepID=UPI0035203004